MMLSLLNRVTRNQIDTSGLYIPYSNMFCRGHGFGLSRRELFTFYRRVKCCMRRIRKPVGLRQ